MFSGDFFDFPLSSEVSTVKVTIPSRRTAVRSLKYSPDRAASLVHSFSTGSHALIEIPFSSQLGASGAVPTELVSHLRFAIEM